MTPGVPESLTRSGRASGHDGNSSWFLTGRSLSSGRPKAGPVGPTRMVKQAPFSVAPGLLRGACHRARIRATRWLAMTGRGRCKPHPVIARSSRDEAIQCFSARRTVESASRRPRPQKLEERRRKQSSPCFAAPGLLRCARNDGERTVETLAPSLRGALATKQSSVSA